MGSVSQTMKAAQWDPHQSRVVVNDIPIPEPAPNQVLVKMASASLCHSDIIAIEMPGHNEPFTLGHEGAGYVSKLGSDVKEKGFKEGDAIGFLYINGCCFECEGCQVHNTMCENGTPAIAGFGGHGFFAEYAVVDWQNVCHLPKELDPKRSSAIFCAGITAFHAVDTCNLKSGQFLAIIGAGGLGQLATQYAHAMGLKVIAIDINDETLAICKAQGADYVFNSRSAASTYVDEIKALTPGKRGVHAAAVFSNAVAAYQSAPALLRPNGIWMFIGIAGGPIEVSSFDLAVGKYRILSESTGIPSRMPKAVEFTAKHNILPELEIRPKGLAEVDDMVSQMRAGKSTKRMAVVFE